jgi:hypothetical protein
MAHFPFGSTTVDALLIAFLVLDFVLLMLVIGATVWHESDRPPESLRAARAPASRWNRAGNGRRDGRAPRRSV